MTTPSSSTATPHQRDAQQEPADSSSGITASAADELSTPRCEWEFRLAATVPSSALPGASDAIGSVDFDQAGRLLATGGIARKIRVYAVASLAQSSCGGEACICVPAKLSSVRWRPDAGAGRVVGCGDYDGVVTEYDVEHGVAAWERDEHAGRRVWALDYAGDGAHAMAASGSDDHTAHVWDPRAAHAGWGTARAGGAVLCVEFDPAGGPHLAVGSADRRACVYDVRALARGPVGSMDGHARAVTYVRWAGRCVVTSAADGTHRLWEWGCSCDGDAWGAGREVRSYSGHVSGRSFVGMGVWRGGGLVASGSESNEVFVYDLRWGKPIWVQAFGSTAGGDGGAHLSAAGSGGFVNAVAWRQDAVDDDGYDDGGGGVLVAGGSDGVLKMFTCRRKQEAGG